MRARKVSENQPLTEAQLKEAWDAVDRFDPGPRPVRRVVASAVAAACYGLMRVLNRLEIEGEEHIQDAFDRPAGRGLLTFSNHVSLFDDPFLTANLCGWRWEEIRWMAADARNFFNNVPKALFFNAGKCVPIIRGGVGQDQPGMDFLAEKLQEGDWVHIFPEGGRTRDPDARLRLPFREGFARLVRESRPLVVPFSHHGMQGVMPIGTKLPRFGNRVQVRISPALDSEDGLADQSSAEITRWAEETLRELEWDLRGPPDSL